MAGVATSHQLTDYYAVLQVHPDADLEVIEAAYRQLMKKYHPDLAGDDAGMVERYHERAKLINEAYSVLRDTSRRRAYDRSHGFNGATSAAPAPSPAPRPGGRPRRGGDRAPCGARPG